MAKEPTGAREECKRTQTAGEIALDVTDFGEGLVWLFVLDLKGRCSVSLSDGSGELSGRSHKRKYAKISSLRYSYKVTENGCSSN